MTRSEAIRNVFYAGRALSSAMDDAFVAGCFTDTQAEILYTYVNGFEDFLFPHFLAINKGDE